MIVNTDESLLYLQGRLLESDSPFAIDTETTWADSLADRRIIGISVAVEDETFYIPVAHEFDPFIPELLRAKNIESVPYELFLVHRDVVMHNAKFDVQMLQQLNLIINTDRLWDTMLMSHYINEYPPHGLKELAFKHLGYDEPKAYKDAMTRMRKNGDGKQEAIPAMGMAIYAEQDAKMTLELFHKLWDDFRIYQNIWTEFDRPFMLVLKNIEQQGLRVNLPEAQRQSALAAKRMADIRTMLGFDPAKPSQLARKLFEIPPIGLGLKPPPAGKSGRPRMPEAYLTSIGHPVTALALEYRGLVKAKSSYFDAYVRLASRENARIHPTFKQHGTVTGRMSCADPNLQQIPRDSEIKKLFLPDEGFELWEFDYRNIEMRLAAVYAKEESMLETFRNEGDVHQMVANQLGIERQLAKIVNFLIIYGGREKRLAIQIGCTVAKAASILGDYRQAYPGLFTVAENAEYKAACNGYVQMWSGRRRHFMYPSEYHKAFNAVIQGGAFEIVKRAGLLLYQYGYDLRNQVHDSWWIQLAPGADRNKVRELMEDWTESSFGLKFTTDEKRLHGVQH